MADQPHRLMSIGRLAEAAACLEIDRITVEIFTALQREGVPAVLLKGVSFARWLYTDGSLRTYVDCDVLVPLELEPAAESVLASCGFVPHPGTGVQEANAVARNHIWSRDGRVVELHTTLIGVRGRREDVWPVLAERLDAIDIAGTTVPTLGTAARCLHAVLHAAQHGHGQAKPLEDLRRALLSASEEEWCQAAELAGRLDALPAFGAGLRLLDEGRALAGRLEPPDPDVTTLLRARSSPPIAFGLERLAESRGVVPKLRLLLRTAFPRPAFLRWWSPLARHGMFGLALAYVHRVVWLVLNLPNGYAAWRRARLVGRSSFRSP